MQVQEEKSKAGMTVPGSVSPQALGITLRIMQTLFVRKEIGGDEHFYNLIK